MSRFFSVFPDGLVGAGLVALRVSLLPLLLAPIGDDAGVGLALAAVAILLLMGLFTRIAATGLAAVTLGATLWAFWNGVPPSLAALPARWMVGAVAVSLALVGPGAYSIDARRFGWQELTVPDE